MMGDFSAAAREPLSTFSCPVADDDFACGDLTTARKRTVTNSSPLRMAVAVALCMSRWNSAIKLAVNGTFSSYP